MSQGHGEAVNGGYMMKGPGKPEEDKPFQAVIL
jgi:hypothetical protein